MSRVSFVLTVTSILLIGLFLGIVFVGKDLRRDLERQIRPPGLRDDERSREQRMHDRVSRPRASSRAQRSDE